MRKKRGAAVLLSLCLLIGLFAPARAMAQGEFSPVFVALFSPFHLLGRYVLLWASNSFSKAS